MTEDTPSPIRGNFIPVSNSFSGRQSTPGRQRNEVGVHIHLNLTDSQMDRLASAFPGQASPAKSRRRRHLEGSERSDTSSELIQIGLSPQEKKVSLDSRATDFASARAHRTQVEDASERYTRGNFSTRPRSSRSRSPAKRSRSPDKHTAIPKSSSSTGKSTIAERRNVPPPIPVDVGVAQKYGRPPSAVIDHVPVPSTPPPLRRMPKMMAVSDCDDDASSSHYSQDERERLSVSPISPLRIQKESCHSDSVFRSYFNQSPASKLKRNDSSPTQALRHRGLQKTATQGDLRQDGGTLERTYSPLSDYLTNREMSNRNRKEMIGERGWLERTSNSSKPSPEKATPQQKKPGLLDSIKKIAKEVTASASRRPRVPEKEKRASDRLNVSLDPREQSLLFCELEFLLTTALNDYITNQLNAGFLDADKYKRIVDGWLARGRTRVVGFRYDLETQLDLVCLHSADFRFYGKRNGNAPMITGLLDMMRSNARAMRIRTFCQPDTVIAKQLLDSQSLFHMIGAADQQQINLAEVIAFFKVILEREQNHRRQQELGTERAADQEQRQGREQGREQEQEQEQWRGSGGSGPTGTNQHSSGRAYDGRRDDDGIGCAR